MYQALIRLVFDYRLDFLAYLLLNLAGLIYADRWFLSRLQPLRQRARTWTLASLLAIAGAAGALMVGLSQRDQLKASVAGFVPTYAAELESGSHHQISLQSTADDPNYLQLINRQRLWLAVNPAVRDIYTLRLTPSGNVTTIVDCETDHNGNSRIDSPVERRVRIGQQRDNLTPVVLSALHGQHIFDDTPHTDGRQSWFSAYAPLRDAAGQPEAVVGVDFAGDTWIRAIVLARSAALTLVLAMVWGFLFATSVSAILRGELEQRRRVADEAQRYAATLKIANDELAHARDAAQSASRAKSEFLANMSHEIRTPMNGIVGLIELVLNSQLTSEQRRHLELIQSSADALMTVLNDILDFSKIEANKLTLDPHPFDLRDMLGDAMKLFGLRAHHRGLELAFRIPPEIPSILVADDGRIRQVLINLVGNAIKFTHQGEIVVGVERVSETDESMMLEFTVRDTGIGIAADNLQKIFEPFRQADGSTTRKYGGTGLGLTICSRLVHMMRGQIEIESEFGQGTTVRFTVQCGKADPKTISQMEGGDVILDNLRALVVDDNATNRLILTEMLHSWKVHASAVEHGQLVVPELERAAAAGEPYNLVLLDLQMPDIDGLQVTRLIRDHNVVRDTIVIMISSCDTINYEQHLRELDLGAYLSKPLKQSELLEACLEVLHRKSRSNTAGGSRWEKRRNCAGRNATVGRALRILVAEDNFVNQQLLLRVLQKDGHEVLLANDGREAIDVLDHTSVDLVLMDVQMPHMDGYEATSSIRQTNYLSRSGQPVPVIALTANAMKGDREKCLASGMDDYVSKPIEFSRLFATIARHLPPITSTADPSDTTPTLTTPSQLAPPSISAHAVETDHSRGETAEPEAAAELLPTVLDQDSFLARVDGDLELVQHLTETFRADGSTSLSSLKLALSEHDFTAIRKTAHTLKGTAGNLGGLQMAAVARSLEQAATAEDQTQAEQLTGRLESAFDQLCQALAALNS